MSNSSNFTQVTVPRTTIHLDRTQASPKLVAQAAATPAPIDKLSDGTSVHKRSCGIQSFFRNIEKSDSEWLIAVRNQLSGEPSGRISIIDFARRNTLLDERALKKANMLVRVAGS
ncbi:hypothetical protein ColTof4_14009 [Colletotrichum tofieldiae]|nr:hypothetical protein ColTof3_14642 [Colletotrichum tofieldiae]GKT81586.1 hypothetical protein ColTof4_14009 [Colletotrichum tofieldiae]GKT97563.1 hypothetical protein Ct61P_15413 [Colletotrichum tofieldiae]